MSRNASGTYTLPTGNPVVSGTDITVTWGNNTMNDIATEITDSLSRSGKGGMLAPLTFSDGTVTQPGISWVSDANTGFFRIGADNMAMTAGGVKIVDYANGAFTFSDTATSSTVGPIFSIFRDSASPADADFIGEIRFDGEDVGSVKTTYAALSGQIDDVTGGTEDGTLLVKTMTAATLTTQLDISSALVNITPATTIAGLTTIASLKGTGAVTITDILDEDNMASNSATKLATQQSIKAYVDAQVDTADTLSEVLAIGNTTGGTDVSVSTDDKVQFRDAAIYINSSTDGQLDIVADTEIQIAATTIDINGAVDVSGNVGVGDGTITPNGSINDIAITSANAAAGITIGTSNSGVGYLAWADTDANNGAWISLDHGTNTFDFRNNSASQLTLSGSVADFQNNDIKTVGEVVIGATGGSSAGNVTVSFNGAADNGIYLRNTAGGSADQGLLTFDRSGTSTGKISQSNTGTSYVTSSDYRLKENVITDWDATTRLKQLKPSRFNFIIDADKTVDGFLAHEVQAIVPEAITGTKDAMKGDGTPDYQGIDQSKLVPLLVKTIQELEARITALEA